MYPLTCLRRRMSIAVKPLFQSLLLSFLLSTAAIAAVDQALLSEARTLLQQGKSAQAYQLLDNALLENAGEPEFDYLLGVAALKADRPEQAMFALERVVQTQPGHAAARMELVAAYTTLGLDRQAQQQLDILKQQNPPPAAREAMSRYRDILRPRLSGTPDPVRLIGLSGGYDSNAGSYPDMGLDLGGLLLTVEPVKSSYGMLRGTWWEPLKIDEKRRLDITVHGQARNYQDKDAEQFNLGLVHAGMLLNTTVDAENKYGLGLQANKLWLDGESFRDHFGARAYWEHRLDAELSGQLGVKLSTFRFDPSTSNYDLFGINGELEKRWSPVLLTTYYADADMELAREDRNGGNAARLTLGGKIDYRMDQRNRVRADIALEHTRYADDYTANTLYNTSDSDKERIDNSFDVALNWNYLLTRDWQVDTDLTWRKQDSSVRFYDVDRWTAQLTVLRYF